VIYIARVSQIRGELHVPRQSWFESLRKLQKTIFVTEVSFAQNFVERGGFLGRVLRSIKRATRSGDSFLWHIPTRKSHKSWSPCGYARASLNARMVLPSGGMSIDALSTRRAPCLPHARAYHLVFWFKVSRIVPRMPYAIERRCRRKNSLDIASSVRVSITVRERDFVSWDTSKYSRPALSRVS